MNVAACRLLVTTGQKSFPIISWSIEKTQSNPICFKLLTFSFGKLPIQIHTGIYYLNPAIQFLPKNDISSHSRKLTIQIFLKVLQFNQNFIRNKIILFAWKLGERLSRERSIFGTRWACNSCGAPCGLFTSWKKGFWTLIGDFQMLDYFTEQLNFSNLSWISSSDWLIAPRENRPMWPYVDFFKIWVLFYNLNEPVK